MTIEDSLRDVLAAKVVDPPQLPGLYGKVTARAAVVRRRRRVAAAVGSCAAVLAIAVPLGLTVSGTSQPRPGRPTVTPGQHRTAHALPVPTTTPAVQPSPSVTVAPTSSIASPTGPAYITDSAGVLIKSPPPPPPVPTISFPVGGAYTAPVMLSDGTRLSLQDKGSTYPLSSGMAGPAVVTKEGILLSGAHGLELFDSTHKLVPLPGSGGRSACPLLVSHDEHYVAWGTQGGPGGTAGGEPTLKGDYLLYDLQARKLVHRYSAQAEACPEAFTTDGRLLMTIGDGAATDAGFWNPSAGTVTLVGTSAAPLGKGITATLWTSKSHAETVDVRPDGNGGCGYYRPGVTGEKAYLGFCGTQLGSPTEDPERIWSLLNRHHLGASDVTTLDATHVGVIATAERKSKGGGFTFTYSWILTCTVPAQGSVTCVRNQQLAPQWSSRSGPDAYRPFGTRVSLVH